MSGGPETRYPDTRWLLRSPNPAGGARLFCFPFAGVGASAYRRWPARIGPLEVCPVQLPGRENRMREQPYHSFDEFAAGAAKALVGYLDRPFAVFGHCMGALLGYALVVELERSGFPVPVRLYASSSLVPYQGFFGPFRPSMSDARLADELRAIADSLGEPEPIPELLALSVPILRNDVLMCAGYQPAGPHPLPCPVTTIGWSTDPDVHPEEMTAWREYAPVRRHVVDGDNFTFLKAPTELREAIAGDFEATGDTASGDTASGDTATGGAATAAAAP